MQPVYGRPMWGANAQAAALNSVLFVSALSISSGKFSSPTSLGRLIAEHTPLDRYYRWIQIK